jgi:HAD superfamily hydrolase (TIGR01458 family)
MSQAIKGIIFDIDGVLEHQGKICSHAMDTVRTLREQGMILRFLTNSTLRSRASCARILREGGFTVFDNEVFTASYVAAAYLRFLRPRSCWIMLDQEGFSEFHGFMQDCEKPEYIVVGDNRSCFDFDHLNKVLRLLCNGSKLIGMQSELVDARAGEIELNVGSWVGMLERASGVHAIYLGKPCTFAIRLVLQSMMVRSHEVAMVGGAASMDVLGAYKIGIQSVLVKTDEINPGDPKDDVCPGLIVNSIQDIPNLLSGN